jgi:superfamily II DNA or RNA helicase
MDMMEYKNFLKKKEVTSVNAGFSVEKTDLNKSLFPFQRDIVAWALQKGKSSVFTDCGSGKTCIQLEFSYQVCKKTGGTALIVAPLSVAEQTRREGEKFGIEAFVVRDQKEVRRGAINITNYEILNHFDPNTFICVVLDESSILKCFTSATRNDLIDSFAGTPYKMCCTATPSPNDFTELGNHAEFMGIMSRAEMLATYFIHDGSDTSKWRLKGYGEEKFWEWVATWAICMRTPKDLGYSDEGYVLPKLNIIEHIIPSEAGAFELFPTRAETLSERREARKESQGRRVIEAKRLVEESDEQWLVWCDYNSESEELHKAINDSVEVVGADSPEYKAEQALNFVDGKTKCLVSKSSIYGMGLNFQNCHNIIYCGISDSFESFYQSVRRCWRYGQEHEVNAHIIISEKELNVLENIKRKEAQMDEMQSKMISLMHDVTMSQLHHTTRITTEYNPKERMGIPSWIA